jgi:hypothetical protein
MTQFIAPTKTASVELPRNGLYIGVVTQIEENRVYVEIPQLTPGFSYGPCLVLANNAEAATTKDGALVNLSGTKEQFVQTVSIQRVVPEVGSFVLCGFLNNGLDEIVVLGSFL